MCEVNAKFKVKRDISVFGINLYSRKKHIICKQDFQSQVKQCIVTFLPQCSTQPSMLAMSP